MPTLRWKSLVLLSVAFGVVEAGFVAVYRLLLDPGGTVFPLLTLPSALQWVEQARELATLLLLVSAAAMLSPRPGTAFAAFLLAFGLWDLVYYAALRAFLGWPRHLGDWDLLFLVPVAWLAPVWAPLLVALAMTTAGAVALFHEKNRGPFRAGPVHIAAAVVGGGLCVASFMLDAAGRHLEAIPQRYPMEWLLLGLGLGIGAFVHAWWRSQGDRGNRRFPP